MANDAILIRPAALDDAMAIAAIHIASWQWAYAGIVPAGYLDGLTSTLAARTERWLGILGRSESQTLVAEAEGRVCGWISFGALRDADASPTHGEIWAIYLDPAAVRRGIGRALWQAATQAIEAAGQDTLYVWVLQGNGSTVDFYRAMGLEAETTQIRLDSIGGVELPVIRMRGPVAHRTPPLADKEIDAVLAFWFGGKLVPRHAWFSKDPSFDASIETCFGHLVVAAQSGGLKGWQATAEGLLAYILLLDQFSRNLFRDQPRAFAGDKLALAAARDAIARGIDQQLHPVQRVFLYLPLEHSEHLADQLASVRHFEALAAVQPELNGHLDYARKHCEVIAQFGRFPHRNRILGRADTPEERHYLAAPGAGF